MRIKFLLVVETGKKSRPVERRNGADIEKGSTSPSTQKQVVIVGAVFAGLNFALKLASDADLGITLIDKNNYQQFQPLLYQVATAFFLQTMLRSICAVPKGIHT